MKIKLIYNRYVAEGLIKRGHKLLRCYPSETNNQFLRYEFEEDKTFRQDMNSIVSEYKKIRALKKLKQENAAKRALLS